MRFFAPPPIDGSQRPSKYGDPSTFFWSLHILAVHNKLDVKSFRELEKLFVRPKYRLSTNKIKANIKARYKGIKEDREFWQRVAEGYNVK